MWHRLVEYTLILKSRHTHRQTNASHIEQRTFEMFRTKMKKKNETTNCHDKRSLTISDNLLNRIYILNNA